ncbi:hypothetical protein CERSUDRAFT_111062 [Gelatoporia subvermispora B]|uniref:Uncharacterized protein n=1 Tax=Ceriporiopsis subvermispora (strain B) TaxID=914234 RepID=M2RPV4_CERS8|nr:hypothetical protein CERSUDRAFT_111062 [Gelatoporia subvermispora B]
MSLLKQFSSLAARASSTASPTRCLGAPARMSTTPFADPAKDQQYSNIFSGFVESRQPTESTPEDSGPPVAPASTSNPAFHFARPSSLFASLADAKKPCYSIYIQASRTNTVATLTNDKKNPILLLSGGKCKFKGRNRSSFEAGYQCAVGLFQRLEEENKKVDLKWELYLKGFGQGREAVQKALLGAEGATVRHLLVRVTDITPLKVGGTRAPKAKRR